MPLFCMIARIGISSLFNLIYVSNVDLFPTLFAATAMGICNFLARIFTILSPQIAELEGSLPMVLYSLLCIGGLFLSILLEFN